MKNKTTLYCALIAALSAPVADVAANQADSAGLNRLLNAGRNVQERVRLSPVREAALKASARALGTQTGLIERAQDITKAVNARREAMERTFRFGDLVIGAGILPPVLVHTQNAAAVKDDVMRLAGAVYHIKQPARFFTGAPSWRDWLLMGLPGEADAPEIPQDEQLLPRDAQERTFWEQEVKSSYRSGYEQAQEIFDHNLSLLEEIYMGMRTFYNLYQRNMVSAPIIAHAQQIVTQDDPNTIVVGDTLFRITMPAHFNVDHTGWRMLSGEHVKPTDLPVVAGFDPEQVRQAYAVHQQQQKEKTEQARWFQGVGGKSTEKSDVAAIGAAQNAAVPTQPQEQNIAVIPSSVQTFPFPAPNAGQAHRETPRSTRASNQVQHFRITAHGLQPINAPVTPTAHVAQPQKKSATGAKVHAPNAPLFSQPNHRVGQQ